MNYLKEIGKRIAVQFFENTKETWKQKSSVGQALWTYGGDAVELLPFMTKRSVDMQDIVDAPSIQKSFHDERDPQFADPLALISKFKRDPTSKKNMDTVIKFMSVWRFPAPEKQVAL